MITVDDTRIRYARWQAEQRPSKGTVILLHGRNEATEKYFETINDLRQRGFGVLTFDWRGQGRSDRLLSDPCKGHIEHFDQYLNDLDAVLNEVALPDCKAPFYILGHSTGALVALLAAPALTNRIRRMVLCAPLLALNNIPVGQTALRRAMGILTFLGLGRLSVGSTSTKPNDKPFLGNKLTSDSERYKRNRDILKGDDTLFLGVPTVSWVFAACRAMARVRETGYSSAISIPTLIVAAGSDAIVDTAIVEQFGRGMRSGAQLTIAGARHEIMQERDIFREQFFAAFDAFVPGSEV